MIRWKALIRDVIFLFVLTFFGAFFIIFVSVVDGERISSAVFGLCLLILMIIGFIIIGCLAKVNRFQHLLQVSVGTWLLNGFIMLLPDIGLLEWFISIVFILIPMLIGGGISFIFVRTPDVVMNEDSIQRIDPPNFY